MARHGVLDEEWAVIEECFPRPKATGRPPMAARQAFDGICWILRSGAPWRDLPEEFGAWETVYAHFNRWASDGTLEKVFERLKKRFSREDRFDHSVWSIDGSVVRAHRCAGGGGKKGIRGNRKTMPWAAPGAVFPQKSMSSAMAKVGR
jgi:transposase